MSLVNVFPPIAHRSAYSYYVGIVKRRRRQNAISQAAAMMGKKGGKKYKANTPPETRSANASRAARARWKSESDEQPNA